MSDQKKRKKWTASEKMRIVLAGLEPGVEVSALCRRKGIHPTQYYNWKSQLVGSAEMVFDEYSRYLVHWELLTSMDGHSISVAAQRALENLQLDQKGKVMVQPIIRSDSGSGYISKEFGGLLARHELTHHRIKPHCPEENGVMEHCNRTIREAIEEHELVSRYDSEAAIRKIINHYNHERLHSALAFETPATWYRGNPHDVSAARRLKLSQARHRRKQFNLGIRQRTLPLEATESTN